MRTLTRAVGALVVSALVAGGLTWGSALALQAAAATSPGSRSADGLPPLPLPTLTLPTVTLPTVTLPTATLPTATLPTATSPTDSTPTLPTSSPTATGTSTAAADVLELLSGLGLPTEAAVGQLVTVTSPVWSLPGVTTTYQWLRDGSPIPGADDPTYVPTLEDAGHALSVQATGALAGLPLVTEVSNALNIPLTTEPALTPAGDITVNGSRKIGTALAISGPTWDPSDATNTYQWLRDGSPIGAATGTTYTLVAADFGHSITAVATGHKEGYTDSTLTSDPVTPVVGDAIQFVMKPRITGTGKVGKLLTADPGQWTGGAEGSGMPTFTYQWLRGTTPVSGAVAQTYQVTTDDIGQALSVTVTATRPAYKAGKFTTSSVTVAKLGSKVRAALSTKSVTVRQKATLAMVVKAAGGVVPVGKVTVLDGKKKLKTITLKRGSKGHASLKLRGLKPGVHKLKAVYAGSPTVAGATSKVVKLKVSKKRS